jgi:hypothetical protein
MGLSTLLGRVFGTEKAMEAAVEGVSKGIDALVYTEEEKAVEAAKDRAAAREMLVQWLEATNGQHLARRLIAVSITGIWLMQYVFSWIAVTAAVFVSEEARRQLESASQLTTEHADGMTGAVMLILSFYFAAPHMDKIVGVAMDRFGGKRNGLS